MSFQRYYHVQTKKEKKVNKELINLGKTNPSIEYIIGAGNFNASLKQSCLENKYIVIITKKLTNRVISESRKLEIKLQKPVQILNKKDYENQLNNSTIFSLNCIYSKNNS